MNLSSPFPSPTYSRPAIDSTECANQCPVLIEDQQTFTSLLGDMSPANTSSFNTLSAIPTDCTWQAPSGAVHGSYSDHLVPLYNDVSVTPALQPTELQTNVVAGVAVPFDNAHFIHPLDHMFDPRFETAIFCDTQTGSMLPQPSTGIPMDLFGDLPLVYTLPPNTLSDIPTDCTWHASSGAVHGSYSGHLVPLCNGVSATPALQPTELHPNVVAGVALPFDNTHVIRPLDDMFNPRFETASAVLQEQGINAVFCDTQTGPMQSRSSARQSLNTARQHGFQFNYFHHQSLPPTPQLSPAQADTVLQSWSPSLTTSPHIPAPVVLASSPSPSLSTFSPPRLSPQPTPPRAQTVSTNTVFLYPSTGQDYYFTEPYQPLKRKVDGRKWNSRKTLKQLKARKEEERERTRKLLHECIPRWHTLTVE
ncbi:hypothetical protein EDD21DRAFT_29215 [Dissophora ornata]|nr:hypothetical protein EDD21DRAFT_29215 [Dissophora ornata]